LRNILANEGSSIIKEPMDGSCRAAVVIPAYNEGIDTLLRPLHSLSKQTGVRPEEFEVLVVVNNRREEAEQRTEAFRTNQDIIEFVRCLRGPASLPQGLREDQKEKINDIKRSGIVIRFIDKSSPENAGVDNNVGMARNRGCAEACWRFFGAGIGETGVVATTDCDCRFSENFVSELIRSFKEYPINGMAGNLEAEADIGSDDAALIRRILEINNEPRPWPKELLDTGRRMFFKKQDKLPHQVLYTGQNLAFSVRAFVMAGGFPPFDSWEDTRFGANISALPGDVVKNLNYTITTLARPSQRAGLSSFGRRVKFILDSVEDFRQGRAKHIYMVDGPAVDSFLQKMFALGRQGGLRPGNLKDLMDAHGMDREGFGDEQAREVVEAVNREFSTPEHHHFYKKTDRNIVRYLYHRFPVRDITRELAVLI